MPTSSAAGEARGPSVKLEQRGDGVEFIVKVVPGASRSKILGVWNDALRLAVSAPPEGGKANEAILKLLTKALSARRGQIEIVSGLTRPVKRIRIAGSTAATVGRAIATALD